MPQYEYFCRQCGNETSDFVKLDHPAPVCDKCDAGAMTRAISSNHFRLRSTGHDKAKWMGSQYSRYRHKTEGV